MYNPRQFSSTTFHISGGYFYSKETETQDFPGLTQSSTEIKLGPFAL